MIRVAIISPAGARARGIADLLAEDERFEVIAATFYTKVNADVAVILGFPPDSIPETGIATVVLSNEDLFENPPSGLVRARLAASATAAQVSAAIIAAANDLSVLTTEQSRHWLRPAIEPQAAEGLTRREIQVLRMLAEGLENKEIAVQLDISEHTAKSHVAQILAKLRASGRTEAVAIGMRRGLVPI